VPDGSGSVIAFNNGKTQYSYYNQAVYGGDAGEISDTRSVSTQRIHMPVFGVTRNGSSVLSIIAEGAAQSTVSAIVSGIDSTYNAVWNSFDLRKVTRYSLEQGWQGKKTFNVYQQTTPTIQTIENHYVFLSGSSAGLAGMAEAYRKFLTPGGASDNKETPSVFVDFLGAVTKKKSVLGFPMNAKLAATTYPQALEIVKSIVENGIDQLNIRYLEWDKLSIERKIINKAKPDSLLGGRNNLILLAEYAKNNNIGFYPDVDPVHFTSLKFPLQQYFNATRNMNNQINKYYPYKLNLFTQDLKKGFSYVLGYKYLAKTVEDYLSSYNKLGISSLSVSSLGSMVTSDYSRGQTIYEPWKGYSEYSRIIEDISKKVDSLLLDDPNIPNALYAAKAINVPSGSSFDMCDYSVPFYQMILSGLVPYAGEAINLTPDIRISFLNVLSSGGNLHYSLNYDSDSSIVKNTDYDSWIAADYSIWLPVIKEQYDELCGVYKKLGSQKLVSYEHMDNGLIKSGFESGGELLVNLSKTPLETNGITVEAEDYVITEGGEAID